MRFSVSGFMLSSLVHMDLSFVQGDRCGFMCILLHEDIQLDYHDLLKVFSFSIFGMFVKNQVSKGVWTYFWAFDSIPLCSLPGFMPVPCGFVTFIIFAISYSLKSGMVIPLKLFYCTKLS